MILRKEKDVIQLSDHFDYKRLLRYCFPSMTMVVFTSIYGVVDGLFVSNFVGKNAFAAINIVMPALMILGALGLMFGSGGTALVAAIAPSRLSLPVRACSSFSLGMNMVIFGRTLL